jgi:hypothetical protein
MESGFVVRRAQHALLGRVNHRRLCYRRLDDVSTLLTEHWPSAARSVLFDGAKLMTGLTDLLDPDQWLASGKNCQIFLCRTKNGRPMWRGL